MGRRDDGNLPLMEDPLQELLTTQSLVPATAAETGASAAVVSTALTGTLTSKLGIAGKVASPFVTLARYSGGVFTEKLRNEAAEAGQKLMMIKMNFLML